MYKLFSHRQLPKICFHDLAIDMKEVYFSFEILQSIHAQTKFFLNYVRSKTYSLELRVLTFVFMWIIPFQHKVTNLKVFISYILFSKHFLKIC
jgi:hypothetical protein